MELTDSQSRRLRRQINTMHVWFTKRCHQLKLMMDHFDKHKDHAMRDFYRAHPSQTIESLVTSTCDIATICPKTFYQWRNEYILAGSFQRSQTGLDQFGWLLVNEDKKMMLTNWCKERKEISVGQTFDYINKELLADFPVGRIPNYGRISRPISYSTAHRWMLYCGCEWAEKQKCFVTQSHEKHQTLLYRIFFCDLDYFLSMRMHRWVCFSSSCLRKLKAHFKDEWPSDDVAHKIPVHDVGKFPPGL